MQKALIGIILFGAAIGALMPSGSPSAPDAAPASGSASNASAGTAESEETSSWGDETRIRRHENGHFYVHAMVNGQLVHFLVDTGATGVALTADDAERVGIPVSAAGFEVIGSGASGPVRGQHIELDEVELDGKRVENVDGVVAEGLEISLLGQTYLTRLQSVEMSGEYMILR